MRKCLKFEMPKMTKIKNRSESFWAAGEFFLSCSRRLASNFFSRTFLDSLLRGNDKF